MIQFKLDCKSYSYEEQHFGFAVGTDHPLLSTIGWQSERNLIPYLKVFF